MALSISDTSEMRTFEDRFMQEVWNERQYDLVHEAVADDYVGHWFGLDGETRGPDELEAFIREVHDGFSDFEMHSEFTVAEDDTVVVGFTTTGTHDGTFMGLPATNEYGESTGIFVHRFEDGAVAEGWASWDALGLFQQLGIVPERFTLTAFLESATGLAKSGLRKRA